MKWPSLNLSSQIFTIFPSHIWGKDNNISVKKVYSRCKYENKRIKLNLWKIYVYPLSRLNETASFSIFSPPWNLSSSYSEWLKGIEKGNSKEYDPLLAVRGVITPLIRSHISVSSPQTQQRGEKRRAHDKVVIGALRGSAIERKRAH